MNRPSAPRSDAHVIADRSMGPTDGVRRQLLRLAAGLFLAAAAPLARHANAQEAASASDRRSTRLVLLGTAGGPPPRKDRAQPASALIVDGEPYLIDCGADILHQLEAAGIRDVTVGKIFITHHHDDHNAGLEPLLSVGWTNGRPGPVDVYGPIGTTQIVAATLEYAKANIAIRAVDEGRHALPASLWRGHDVRPGPVYADRNVRVTCVENTHFEVPGQQSLSYRFDTADRSVVFSGDTGYSENLIELARGADVLVHEAMQVDATRPILQGVFAKQGRPQAEIDSLIVHVLTRHTSTEDVGKVAAAAGVGMLVMNHLIPGGLEQPLLSDDDYIRGARRFYSGPIVVGRDLQSL